MFFETFSFAAGPVIKVLLTISILWIVKKVFDLIKYLHHYSKFPRDPDCSFLFGDLIQFLPNYWNTQRTTFRTHLTRFLVRTASDYRKNEGLGVIWVGWQPLIFLCDYRCIESVMNKNLLTKPSFYKFIGMKEGLVTSGPDKWKLRRKTVEPFFISKQQRLFVLTIDQVFDSLINEELVSLVDTEKTVSMNNHIHSSTCDIIFKISLNLPVEASKKDKLHIMRTIDLMELVTMSRIFNPLLWNDRVFSRTESGIKFGGMIARVYEFFDSSTRQKIDKNSNEMGRYKRVESAPIDFVRSLMDSNKGKIDLQGVNEELFTLIAAGHETTSTALNWTLFILGNRLDVQEKLYQEVSSVFSDNEPVNEMEKINQCNYLEACLKESLRLYPPIPVIARELEEDIDVNGLRCLKGSTILCSIFSIHRDPRIYPNPSHYDPGRFNSDNAKEIPRGAYLPFGILPRNCVGFRFALIEMKIFMIHILRRFEIISVKKLEDVSVILELTLKPSSQLDITLRKRQVH